MLYTYNNHDGFFFVQAVATFCSIFVFAPFCWNQIPYIVHILVQSNTNSYLQKHKSIKCSTLTSRQAGRQAVRLSTKHQQRQQQQPYGNFKTIEALSYSKFAAAVAAFATQTIVDTLKDVFLALWLNCRLFDSRIVACLIIFCYSTATQYRCRVWVIFIFIYELFAFVANRTHCTICTLLWI